MKPSKRKWRSLVRIDSVDWDDNVAYVIVPGWDPTQILTLRDPGASWGPEILEKVIGGARYLIARVNLGAEEISDLEFNRWEVSDDPPDHFFEFDKDE